MLPPETGEYLAHHPQSGWSSCPGSLFHLFPLSKRMVRHDDLLSFDQRQLDPESGALPLVALYRDPPAMTFGNRSCQVETNTHSREGPLGPVGHLIESLKNLLVMRLVNTYAEVLHRDFCLALLGSYSHKYMISLGRISDRVHEQIDEHLPKAASVACKLY